MKVAVFGTEEWEHQACLRLQPAHEIVCTREPLNRDTVGECLNAEVISPFVNSSLDREVLRHFSELKLIATRSTGYDHIDLSYCRSRGIIVCNVPDYGASTVAEHAFVLLLAISRRIGSHTNRAGHRSACRSPADYQSATVNNAD